MALSRSRCKSSCRCRYRYIDMCVYVCIIFTYTGSFHKGQLLVGYFGHCIDQLKRGINPGLSVKWDQGENNEQLSNIVSLENAWSSGFWVRKSVHMSLPIQTRVGSDQCRGLTLLISISVFTFHLNDSVIGTLSLRIIKVRKFREEPVITPRFQRQNNRDPEWNGVSSPRSHREGISWARTRPQCFEANLVPFPPYVATFPRVQSHCVEG